MSAKPNWLMAATESPPPIKEKAPFAVAFTMASAMALVPTANFGISNTPTGPFQRMVLDCSMTLVKEAILSVRSATGDR